MSEELIDGWYWVRMVKLDNGSPCDPRWVLAKREGIFMDEPAWYINAIPVAVERFNEFRRIPTPDELTAQAADITRLNSECDAWEKAASEHYGNSLYYRGLVVGIGETLGDAAKTCDNGSKSLDVLCAKVPELVTDLRVRLEAAEGALRDIARLPCSIGGTLKCLALTNDLGMDLRCPSCRANAALAPAPGSGEPPIDSAVGVMDAFRKSLGKPCPTGQDHRVMVDKSGNVDSHADEEGSFCDASGKPYREPAQATQEGRES